jgi:ABC-type polysaccharide/polyol phosphate export permease
MNAPLLRGPLRTLGTVASQRRLFLELTRRDVRARFAGARAGLAWSLLGPLVQLASYSAVFAFVYRATGGESLETLVARLFCGLWPWWAFQEGTLRGTTALVDQAPLLKRLPLPLELCVLAAVAASFLLQMIGFGLFLAAANLLGIAPTGVSWLWLPVAALLALAFASGLALVLAPIHLVVRDTMHVLTAVMTVWFFASPVLYAIEQLPAEVARWMSLNPFTAIPGLVRHALLGSAPPGAAAALSCASLIACAWLAGPWLMSRARDRLDEFW